MRTEGHIGSKSVKIMEVVQVQTKVGSGTGEDPFRTITEYWSKEGELLAFYDPHFDEYERAFWEKEIPPKTREALNRMSEIARFNKAMKETEERIE